MLIPWTLKNRGRDKNGRIGAGRGTKKALHVQRRHSARFSRDNRGYSAIFVTRPAFSRLSTIITNVATDKVPWRMNHLKNKLNMETANIKEKAYVAGRGARKALAYMKTDRIGTRRALAAAYFPDTDPESAVRRLGHWIRRCRPLYRQLTKDGTPFDKRRLLTVREVRLIIKYLGEPDGET